MAVGIGILLTVLVIVVIVWPFLRPGRDPKHARQESTDGQRLIAAKEEVFRQIRQLQHDRNAGLIPDSEYQSHLRELRVEAAQFLRAQERLGAESSPEDELEREIEAVRRSQRAGGSPERE